MALLDLTLPRLPRRFARPRMRALLHLLALRREHGALARLDDRLLHDIGVTRDEAEAELRRSVWDAPAHWQD